MPSEVPTVVANLAAIKPTLNDHPTSPIASRRHLPVGTQLFAEGLPREYVYRVEQGTVAVYMRHLGRPNHVTTLARPGDYLGLGCLATYSESAVAIEAATLACFDLAAFNRLAEGDVDIKKLQTDAIHAEFEKRKAMILDCWSSTPAECVAAFLVAVSRQNVREGFDPNIVQDTCECGAVANLLGLDIDTLAQALLSLKSLGLIHERPNGELHLKRLYPLERMAEGLDPYVSGPLVDEPVYAVHQM
jgi:CRP-like cAMP-binding protein